MDFAKATASAASLAALVAILVASLAASSAATGSSLYFFSVPSLVLQIVSKLSWYLQEATASLLHQNKSVVANVRGRKTRDAEFDAESAICLPILEHHARRRIDPG